MKYHLNLLLIITKTLEQKYVYIHFIHKLSSFQRYKFCSTNYFIIILLSSGLQMKTT